MAPTRALQQTERIGQFKGDGEVLVDRLIKACEQKPTSKAGSAPFGRQLVPWTDDSALNVTFEALEARARRTSPMRPRSCKGGGKALQPTKDQLEAVRCSPSSAPRTRGPAGTKRVSSIGYACPALASAPKARDLPMPTSALMNRAGVRSRSPSPPSKDGTTLTLGRVQQLVWVAV